MEKQQNAPPSCYKAMFFVMLIGLHLSRCVSHVETQKIQRATESQRRRIWNSVSLVYRVVWHRNFGVLDQDSPSTFYSLWRYFNSTFWIVVALREITKELHSISSLRLGFHVRCFISGQRKHAAKSYYKVKCYTFPTGRANVNENLRVSYDDSSKVTWCGFVRW